MAVELTPAELDLTREKLAKINARAARKGLAGHLDVTTEPVERLRDTAIPGLRVREVRYLTTITGQPPAHNGYTLLAALDWTDNGPIVRTAPGVPDGTVNRDTLTRGHCGHCGLNRHRKSAYIVWDGEQQIQVGSTCIKDYLGWTGGLCFLTEDDGAPALSGLGGGTPAYSTEDVLAVAWAVVTTHGFVPSRQQGSTRSLVALVLDPDAARLDKNDRALVAELRPLARQAAEQGKALREFVLSDGFAGDGDYVRNLKTLCADDAVGVEHLGLLASAPQAWARAQERTLIRRRQQADRDNAVDEWVGQERDRVQIRVRVSAIRYKHNDFGCTTIYTLLADSGHMFTWFASNSTLGDDVSDTWITLAATIKGHSEYQGLKSTIVTRCRVLAEEPASAGA